MAVEYFPRGQATQAVLLTSYLPATHSWQSVAELDPMELEMDPAGQAVHADDPSKALYLPASQDVQLSREVTPYVVYFPTGHLEQA